jgi:hypothetical protein
MRKNLGKAHKRKYRFIQRHGDWNRDGHRKHRAVARAKAALKDSWD